MENKEVIKVNALDLRSFDENRFNPKVVYESDEIKVILAYFKQGQFIPVHTPGIDVVLCILEGKAEVVAGKKKTTSMPGVWTGINCPCLKYAKITLISSDS